MRLGVGKKHASFTAISSKSDRRLSRALVTNSGMTHEWLKEQGSISFRELSMKVQGYVRTSCAPVS